MRENRDGRIFQAIWQALRASAPQASALARLRHSPNLSGSRPEHFAALHLGWRRLLTELLSSLSRNQNRKRTVACSDLGPPVCSTGDSPLPGLPVPSMRFNIEVD